MTRKTSRAALVSALWSAHDRIRALASRLDLPGWLRAELHRAANGMLAVLLNNRTI